MSNALTFVYLLSTIPYFWYNLQHERDTSAWSVFIKCFPTILLIPFTLLTFKSAQMKKWHTLALVFATVGDFVFAYGYEYDKTMMAATAFIIHHICYLITYWPVERFWFLGAVPLFGWGAFLNQLLWKNLPWQSPLAIIIIHTYGATLSLQTWFSLSKWKYASTEEEKTSSFWRALGFLTLVASDSMIGIGNYVVAFRGWELYVIFTYFWCEYFIFIGNMIASKTKND